VNDPEGGCSLGHQRVLKHTELATLVVNDDGDQLWVPHSVIHDDSEVYIGLDVQDSGDLIVEAWWAEEKGFA